MSSSRGRLDRLKHGQNRPPIKQHLAASGHPQRHQHTAPDVLTDRSWSNAQKVGHTEAVQQGWLAVLDALSIGPSVRHHACLLLAQHRRDIGGQVSDIVTTLSGFRW
jgi:hypothetical protein